MRAVLDTSVLVAAMRSRTGASRQLIGSVLEGRLRPLVSVALVLEYEAVLTRLENLRAFGVSREEAVEVVKAFCRKGESVHIERLLRPQLRDPDDEFILEAAFNGAAEVIVTLNRKDFLGAERFGISILSPGEALERLKRP